MLPSLLQLRLCKTSADAVISVGLSFLIWRKWALGSDLYTVKRFFYGRVPQALGDTQITLWSCENVDSDSSREVCRGTWESALLTNCLGLSVLLAWGPHLEYRVAKVLCYRLWNGLSKLLTTPMGRAVRFIKSSLTHYLISFLLQPVE